VLRALVERRGALVSKGALIESAWSGRLVEESNLTVQIAALRRVLGEAPGGDRWIETMQGRGYRFVGPIATGMAQGATAAPPQVDTAREPAPTARADAERRQITAMSCELIGISGGADGVGLEDLRDAVAAFQRCVSETVDRHDGFVVSRLGNAARSSFLATPRPSNTTLSARSRGARIVRGRQEIVPEILGDPGQKPEAGRKTAEAVEPQQCLR
jgi:DNA-binding winged helix-turn-helix (wHTH) protein